MGGSESAPGYHYVKVREVRRPTGHRHGDVARRAREVELERFIGSIVTEAMRFSGHLGMVTLRPAEDGDRTYRVVFRFDYVSSLRRWERSEERRRWLQLAKDAGVADAAPDVRPLPTRRRFPGTHFASNGRRRDTDMKASRPAL